MRIDLGLEVAVDAFVEAVTEALVAATASLPATDPDSLRASAVTEAFDISCAFIDADGLATDDELWGLIRAFGSRLGPDFARAVPDDLRRDGTTAGAQQWARTTSDLFEILVGVDRRDHTDRATTYYTHAMALAHTVASLDTHTGRDELLALDAYRSLLLDAIKAPPGAPATTTPTTSAAPTTPTPPTTPSNLGSTGAPERAGSPQVGVEGAADVPPRDLDDLLDELDALVGLAEVKREVRLVANLLQVQRLRRERGMPVVASSRHLVFTGNPGTGKTTVARLLAQIYRTLGVVSRGHLVESDRSRLVAGYVGQTATKVTEAFDEADEGVLLIDEAYALVRGSDTDFGREAIDTIVKLVEDRRDRLVVIVAGYPDEMQSFLEANPGLPSRFPRTIAFPDYTDEELIAIFEAQCETGGYRCDASAATALRAAIAAIPRGKGFGNGRLVRNLFERAIERQASRLVDRPDPTDLELTTLTGADLVDAPASPEPQPGSTS
ncbi:MAG: AAA family ATPase [Acidimicrobiales bacterium]